MIPLNDTCLVYKAGKKDSWGIAVTNIKPIKYNCMIVFSSDLQELTTVSGEKIVITAEVTFKGEIDIDYKDNIDIGIDIDNSTKLEVKKILPIRDLSGKTLYTKVVI